MKSLEQGDLFAFLDRDCKYFSIVKEITALSHYDLVTYTIIAMEKVQSAINANPLSLPNTYRVGETYSVSSSWVRQEFEDQNLQLI